MQWIPSVIYHFSILGKNYTAILEKSIMLFLSFKWWWLLSEITAWNSFVELSCLSCLLQLAAACIELDFKVIYSIKHSLIFFLSVDSCVPGDMVTITGFVKVSSSEER